MASRIDRQAPVRLLSIVGTRPEAIKIAPVALAAADRPLLSHRILATGQHGALFDEALAGFGLRTDIRLGPVLHDRSPAIMTQRYRDALIPVIEAYRPDAVIVQGDTTSALAGALAADAAGVLVAHVEAGLRSQDLASPWPEEINRVWIDRIATLLFAPTLAAEARLSEEQVCGEIHVTGNTGVDALLMTRADLPTPASDGSRLILLTCHRRENIPDGIEHICDAALRLADRGDVRILCPVHPNPAVSAIMRGRLGRHPAITLIGALGYRETVAAMRASSLILTDSGGIQEEAPALGVPTLVLREVTERSEGIATGNLALVGTDPDRIVGAASLLLDDPVRHATMAQPRFPFGRGGAAAEILDHIERYFLGVAIHEPFLPFARIGTMDARL